MNHGPLVMIHSKLPLAKYFRHNLILAKLVSTIKIAKISIHQ